MKDENNDNCNIISYYFDTGHALNSARDIFPFDPQHSLPPWPNPFEVCRLAKPSYFINCGIGNVIATLNLIQKKLFVETPSSSPVRKPPSKARKGNNLYLTCHLIIWHSVMWQQFSKHCQSLALINLDLNCKPVELACPANFNLLF